MATLLYATAGALVLTAFASWLSPAPDEDARATATYLILAAWAAVAGWAAP